MADRQQTQKIVKAELNYLRIAPRKVRMVADTIKGLSVNEAEAQLLFQKRRPAKPILKLLRSAVANAKSNNQLKAENLGIVDIRVDGGPKFKRHMPRAMGRATLIEKKTSHITLVLEESDKFKPRFTAFPARPKKEKAAKKKEKKEDQKPAAPQTKKETKTSTPKKPGFFQKMFRRKSI